MITIFLCLRSCWEMLWIGEKFHCMRVFCSAMGIRESPAPTCCSSIWSQVVCTFVVPMAFCNPRRLVNLILTYLWHIKSNQWMNPPASVLTLTSFPKLTQKSVRLTLKQKPQNPNIVVVLSLNKFYTFAISVVEKQKADNFISIECANVCISKSI